MNAIYSIAAYVSNTRAGARFFIFFSWLLLALTLLALGGCGNSILQPVRPAVYDFGPGDLSAPAPHATATYAPLVLGAVDAPPALESQALHYRLAYAHSQQLKPYAQARWSMTPAQLLRQRLSEQLGQHRAVLNPGESPQTGALAPATLRVDLEEFSHLFEAPGQSIGLVRLRATLVKSSGNPQVIQRSFVAQRPAASADASGGARALGAASHTVVQEIDAWLRSLRP